MGANIETVKSSPNPCNLYGAAQIPEGRSRRQFVNNDEYHPLRDNNILVRQIKSAARKLNMGWVNWLQQAGVDVKDAQGIMRHSRASTTQDVYQQLVPQS